jgi:uncharacterized protein (TIGR00255 family)
MNSMTGFGKAELTSKVGRFTVEISSVNSRYLEVNSRLPRKLFALEARVRALASEQLKRGKVNIFVGYEEADGSPTKYRINSAAVKTYHQQLKTLQGKLKLSGEISLASILQLPDVAGGDDTSVDVETMWPALSRVLKRAVKAIVAMRKREGQSMANDMTKRLKIIRKLTGQVMKAAPLVGQKYRKRLQTRIDDLVAKMSTDRSRLEEEIAIFAEKTDITEECTRLLSHITEYQRSLTKNEPVGKRLNFILQEMNREVNTIGSKCSDLDISKAGIALKEETEKLRELVQNVE